MSSFLFDYTEPITPAPEQLRFVILGRAQQRGSKKSHVLYGRDGKPVMKGGRAIVVTRDQNDDKSLVWMQEVKSVARAAMVSLGLQKLIDEPVSIDVKFWFKRPDSHYGSGKNRDRIKPSSPKFHVQSPDLDKLQRCLGDALTGVVYTDDKLIWQWNASRHWTDECEQTDVVITRWL